MNLTKENNIDDKLLDKYQTHFPPKKQRCVYVLYWRTNGLTLKKIADILKVTTERVRQMEAWGVEYIRWLESQNRH